MANVTDLIEYYVSLLIIQYHDKPKAQATIRLFVKELLCNGVMFDVLNGYTVEDAVGKQLDVVGKYVGVDRFYSELVLENYFSLVGYSELGGLPASPPRFGFSDYATYADYAYNGTLQYGDIITTQNSLFDDYYRILIKLKIIQNNSNYSEKEIDDAMFKFFGGDIRPESNGNMRMVYFITSAITTLIQAMLYKGLLPHPMGVGVGVVSGVTGMMFSLTDYTNYESPYGYGFSTYADYATLPGQVLTYDQIS